MEAIKFDEISPKTQPVYSVLLLVCIVFLLLNLFNVFSNYLNERILKYIVGFCYLVVFWRGIKLFVYRNIVQWNKRGINIRVNEFWGKNYSFDTIKQVIFSEDRYTVITDSGKSGAINLEGIEQESKERLLHILRSHTE